MKDKWVATIVSVMVFLSASSALALIKGFRMSGCGPQIQFEKQMLAKVTATPKFCDEGLIPVNIGVASCKRSKNPSCPTQGITCITQFECVAGVQAQEAPDPQLQPVSEPISEPVSAPLSEPKSTPSPTPSHPETSLSTSVPTAVSTSVPTQEVKSTPLQAEVAQAPVALSNPSPIQPGEKPGSTASGLIFGLGLMLLWWAGLFKIFQKAGESGGKSLIPFYNIFILYRIVGLSPIWAIGALIPYIGLIPHMVMCKRVSQRFGHGMPMAAFLTLFPYFAFPYLGFKDSEIFTAP